MGQAQYFMRVRGRVLGPFDQDKLQGLSRRGQLSRMHEVSTDGVTWVRASTYPELFVIVPIPLPTAETEASYALEPAPPTAINAPPAPGPAANAKQDWYYTSFGQEHGAVDFANLQLLAGTGQLGAQDLVWTSGMATWLPAAQVPGLIRSSIQSSTDTNTGVNRAAGAEEALPVSLCTAAETARPWVLFIAITGYILGALLLIGGLLTLIAGAKAGSVGAVGIFTGLVNLIQSAIVVAGSLMLSAHASRLGNLSHNPSPLVMEKALITLRTFWIFISINLIVWLAFVGAFVVLLFSSVISLPSF